MDHILSPGTSVHSLERHWSADGSGIRTMRDGDPCDSILRAGLASVQIRTTTVRFDRDRERSSSNLGCFEQHLKVGKAAGVDHLAESLKLLSRKKVAGRLGSFGRSALDQQGLSVLSRIGQVGHDAIAHRVG